MPNPSVINAEVCIYFGLFLPKAALQRGRLSLSAALWTAARIQIRIEHQPYTALNQAGGTVRQASLANCFVLLWQILANQREGDFAGQIRYEQVHFILNRRLRPVIAAAVAEAVAASKAGFLLVGRVIGLPIRWIAEHRLVERSENIGNPHAFARTEPFFLDRAQRKYCLPIREREPWSYFKNCKMIAHHFSKRI